MIASGLLVQPMASSTNRTRLKAGLTGVALILLSGCVQSAEPILGDAKPVFGERMRFQIYSLRGGAAHEPQTASYRWNGTRYVRTGGFRDVSAFTMHAFEGRDSIVQSFSRKPDSPVEYALARWVAPGTYFVFAIDESEIDAPTRTKFCATNPRTACRIDTPEQLFGLARAAASLPHDHGGLAIRLSDKP